MSFLRDLIERVIPGEQFHDQPNDLQASPRTTQMLQNQRHAGVRKLQPAARGRQLQDAYFNQQELQPNMIGMPRSTGVAQFQGSPQLQGSQVPLQGLENPGFIPLQNSGKGGMGYTANLQPAEYNLRNLFDQQSRY